MSNFTYAFVIMIILNTLLFISDQAIHEIGPGTNQIYNCTDGVFDKLTQGKCNNLAQADLSDATAAGLLPDAETGTSAASGLNVFTDIFTSIVKWFKNSPLGIGASYVSAFLITPYRMLIRMNLPVGFKVAVGGAWYAIGLMVLVGYFWWRD